MILKRSLPDQFAIFAFIWSAATISHQFYYGLIFSSNLDSLLTLLAFITILQPFRYKLFLIQVFVQVITIFNQLPYVFNHWFLAFFVSIIIVLSYLKLIYTNRSFSTTSDELYTQFAPALRIVLLIVYFSAFFHKLNADYFSIDVSCGVMMYSRLWGIFNFLPKSTAIQYISIYLSLIIEIGIPILLLFRSTRIFGVLLGLYTHLIMGFIGYINFSIIMFALLVLYLPGNYFLIEKSIKDEEQNRFNKSIEVLKFFLYSLSLIFVIFYIFNRFGYILDQIKINKSIAKVNFSLFGFLIIITFLYFLKSKSYLWSKSFYKINFLQAFILLLFMLNTASPYLGFKTQNVFSMYSNLSTENYSSNHLLVKNGSLFGKFQNDLVIIGKTNIDKLKQHKIMVYEQMKNYVYEEFRKGKGNYEVLYIRNGKQINLKKEDFF